LILIAGKIGLASHILGEQITIVATGTYFVVERRTIKAGIGTILIAKVVYKPITFSASSAVSTRLASGA
jgi:hypothetical protein